MTFPEIFDNFKNHSYIRRKSWNPEVFINLRYTAPLIRLVMFDTVNIFNNSISIKTLNNDMRLSTDDLLADDWEDIENY